MHILTVTINPALDKSTSVDRVIPERKLRCDTPSFEPGGGGINVSRALSRLGASSTAFYAAGGRTGARLNELLDAEGIRQHIISTREETRENFMVMEGSTGQQYRFGMPGPTIAADEQIRFLAGLESFSPAPDFLVVSGSLSPGIPDDFFGRIARIARQMGSKMILDTSGIALKKSLEEGVYLTKPNLNELAQLAGKDQLSPIDQENLAQKTVRSGQCEIMVVSLGPRGAMLVTKDRIEYFVPPTVKTKSKIGAGDSMVAGMVYKLAENWPITEVVRYGIATGTAATMTAGSELCRKEDAEQLYYWLRRDVLH
jgi:6-phosphofructokinase 2